MPEAGPIVAPAPMSVFVQQDAAQTQPEPGMPALPGTDPVIAPADPLATEDDAEPADPLPDDGSVIVVEAGGDGPPGDPIYKLNEQSYEVTQKLDEALVEPVATVYEEGLPGPVRRGLSNFFQNLREPVVFINFMLQLKPGKALETLGRFAVNSTLGLGGLVDVAKRDPFNLPYRNNGFANTLGYYGVEPGAFIYLPLIGATTVRDLVGNTLDAAVLPFSIGKPFNTPYYAAPSYVVRSFDERIRLEEKHRIIRESASPYYLMREIYLCERQAAIDALRGREAEDCNDTFGIEVPGSSEAIQTAPDAAPAPLVPDASADPLAPPVIDPAAAATVTSRAELPSAEVRALLCPGEDDPFLETDTAYTGVIALQCGA